jgi:hypothetical protein
MLIIWTCPQEGEEELGEVYQDEASGAALLIRRHPKHGKLVVVSTLTLRRSLSLKRIMSEI